MKTSSTPARSTSVSNSGPMMYMSTSEDGRTPATVIAVGAVFSALPAITVVLRFCMCVTRFRLSTDDWLMLAACVLTLGMGLMLIIGALLPGLAQPTPQGWAPGDYFWVTDDALIITEKIFWVFIMTQAMAFGLVKLSILYFYRRIFPSRTFSILSGILIVLVGSWTVGFFFAYVFRCGANFWALWAPLMYLLEYCYDSKPMFYTLGVSDVATDAMILSLPWYWIWRLNMSVAKRLAIACVFLLGFFEVGTGIARLVIFIQQTSDWVQTADGNGLLTTMMVWSMVEMGIAVVAGCLPTIWPLISKASLEEMMRTVRGILSFESLRSSRIGRFSSEDQTKPDDAGQRSHHYDQDQKSTSGAESTPPRGSSIQETSSYSSAQMPSQGEEAPRKDVIQIRVKKDVSVMGRPLNVPDGNGPGSTDPRISPGATTGGGVNDGNWNSQVRTDTRVISNGRFHDTIV